MAGLVLGGLVAGSEPSAAAKREPTGAATPPAAGPGSAAPAGPLETADPVAALVARSGPLRETSDLDPIVALLAGRRLALLGEATHGTREFYAWRDVLTRRLVAEHGFRFVVLEADGSQVQRLSAFVRNEPGAPATAREALAQLDRWPPWMWANDVIAGLLDWLRAHNAGRSPAEHVGLYGMDMQDPVGAAAAVAAYAATLDGAPEALDVACARAHLADHAAHASALRQGIDCRDELAQAMQFLRQQRGRLAAADATAYFHAKWNLRALQASKRQYRAPDARGERWNVRARHFHDTAGALLERYGPDSRGLAWAHDTHVGDARATTMVEHGMGNIGQHAREALGDGAVGIVGQATHAGRATAAPSWGSPAAVVVLPPAAAGTWDELLNRAAQAHEAAATWTIFGPDPPAVLLKRRGKRAVGVVADPRRAAGSFVPTALARRYDAILFVAETTPIEGL